MAADQRLWGYPAIAAHLGISIGAARSRRSRGALPVSDDESIPDRLRWQPAIFRNWKPLGPGYRSDLAIDAIAWR